MEGLFFYWKLSTLKYHIFFTFEDEADEKITVDKITYMCYDVYDSQYKVLFIIYYL